MAMKYTPKPWVVTPYTSSAPHEKDAKIDRWAVYNPSKPYNIAVITNMHGGSEVAEANVNLIKAAPDMFEVLEAIQARLNGEWDNPALKSKGYLHTYPEKDIAEWVDEVLAKVKGEQT